MIRRCHDHELPLISDIINDAAMAYKGVIPADCFHEPYMPMDNLQAAIAEGVIFWGWEEDGVLVGVMGIQDVGDVTLIRHAYVRTVFRNKGIGCALLRHLLKLTSKPVLIGTWRAAVWAIRFYIKHGFVLADEQETSRLLRQYWNIPARQVETSVVLRQASAAYAHTP